LGLSTDKHLQGWYVDDGRGRRLERWLVWAITAFGIGAMAYGAVYEIPRLTPRRGTSAGSQAAPAEQIVRRPGLLALGTSLTSAGRPAELVALVTAGRVLIRSRSSRPVAVSVSTVSGQAPRYWTRLRPGEARAQSLISGRSYSYCFSQPSGDGYAASRGCGHLVVHRYLGAARLPDGGAVRTGFSFMR
jgi:hypothetical protein